MQMEKVKLFYVHITESGVIWWCAIMHIDVLERCWQLQAHTNGNAFSPATSYYRDHRITVMHHRLLYTSNSKHLILHLYTSNYRSICGMGRIPNAWTEHTTNMLGMYLCPRHSHFDNRAHNLWTFTVYITHYRMRIENDKNFECTENRTNSSGFKWAVLNAIWAKITLRPPHAVSAITSY